MENRQIVSIQRNRASSLNNLEELQKRKREDTEEAFEGFLEEDIFRSSKRTLRSPNQAKSNPEENKEMEKILEKLEHLEMICKDTRSELKEIRTEFKGDIDSLTESVDFLANKYDDFVEEFKKEKEENKKRHERIKKLEEENAQLWKKVEEVKLNLNDLDQYHRKRHFEIHGVEERDDENLYEILADMAKMLQLEYNSKEVEAVHRIQTRNQKKRNPIIVSFLRRKVTEAWLTKRKTGLQSKNLVTESDEEEIYINENLTIYTKDLFWKARQANRDRNYKYVWVRNGKIFAKKTADSEAKQIRTEEDINKIFAKKTTDGKPKQTRYPEDRNKTSPAQKL